MSGDGQMALQSEKQVAVRISRTSERLSEHGNVEDLDALVERRVGLVALGSEESIALQGAG